MKNTSIARVRLVLLLGICWLVQWAFLAFAAREWYLGPPRCNIIEPEFWERVMMDPERMHSAVRRRNYDPELPMMTAAEAEQAMKGYQTRKWTALVAGLAAASASVLFSYRASSSWSIAFMAAAAGPFLAGWKGRLEKKLAAG